MNTTELIEIARECGGRYAYTNWGYHPFTLTELQQLAQRIEAPHLQRIAELTHRADKVADNLEQAEKQLTEIAYKTCATLDAKDTRIAELELSLQKQAKAALQGMDSANRVSSQMLHDAKQIQSSLKPELLDSERQANAVLTEENEKLQQQIEQLREALEDALRYKRADEKLVDIINGIEQQQQKPKHGRQA